MKPPRQCPDCGNVPGEPAVSLQTCDHAVLRDPTVRWQRASLREALVDNVGIALIGLVVGGVPMSCGLIFWIAAIVDGHATGYVVAALSSLFLWIPIVLGGGIFWLCFRDILFTRCWHLRSDDGAREGQIRLRAGRVVEGAITRTSTVTRGIQDHEWQKHSTDALDLDPVELLVRTLIGLHARGAISVRFQQSTKWQPISDDGRAIMQGTTTTPMAARAAGAEEGWLEKLLLAESRTEPRPVQDILVSAVAAISREVQTVAALRKRIRSQRGAPGAPSTVVPADTVNVTTLDGRLTEAAENAVAGTPFQTRQTNPD